MANDLVVYSPRVGEVAKTFGAAAKQVGATTQAVAVVEKPVNDEAKKFVRGLLTMVAYLASIDHTLKANLKNRTLKHQFDVQAAREAKIESTDTAEPPELDTPDAVRDDGPSIGQLAVLGGVLALTFEPFRDLFKSLYDASKFAFDGVSSIAGSIADAFQAINSIGAGEAAEEAPPPAATPKSEEQVRKEYDAMPWYEQAGTAVNDMARLAANAATFGFADNIAAAMGAGEGETYEQRLQSQNQMSSDAATRAGLAGTILSAAVGIRVGTGLVRGARSAGRRVMSRSAPVATSAPAGPASTVSRSTAGRVAGAAVAGATVAGALSTPQPTQPDATAEPDQKSKEKTAAAGGAIPKNDIVALGRYLQGQGMRVSGHSQFGGQERGKHSANSRHYRDQALDINIGYGLVEANDPKAGAKFDALKSQLEAAGYSVIWRSADHYNHMHVSVGGPEGPRGGEYQQQESMASAAATMTLGAMGRLATALRGITTQDNVARTPMEAPDYSRYAARMTDAAKQTNAARIQATVTPPPSRPAPPSPPNLNMGQPGGTVSTRSTTDEGGDVMGQYLTYFGIREAVEASP